MLMHLVPLAGGPVIPIDKPILFFGRQPECDVVLLNSRKVSRKHCCIAQIDDHFVVRDLGSMNGIRVNEKPVSKECRIAAGDVVHVGDIAFRLEIRQLEKKASAAAPLGKKPGAIPTPKTSNPPPQAKPPRRVDPQFLSQDLPVVIPDEEVDFHIEETQRKVKSRQEKRRPSDKAVNLDDLEMTED